MPMKIGIRWLAALLALALTLAACGGQDADTPPPDNGGDESSDDGGDSNGGGSADIGEMDVFRIPMDRYFSRFWVVDAAGNTVENNEDFVLLHDLLTGEPQCKYLYRVEGTGEADEYGSPKSRSLSALYDLEGNLLQDWAEISYQAGFGNCVIRSTARDYMMDPYNLPEGFQSALWDFTTEEVVIADAGRCMKLGEDKILVNDYHDKLMGVLNGDGSTYSGFPAESDYYNAYPAGNHITASPINYYAMYNDPEFDSEKVVSEALLLNDKLEVLQRGEWISELFTGGLEDAFQIVREGVTTVISADGTQLFQVPEGKSLSYFDGQLAILQEETGYGWSYSLVTAEGETLTKGYRELAGDYLAYEDSNTSAQQFLAVGDNKARLLDRKGESVLEIEIPNVSSIYRAGEKRYTFATESGSNEPGVWESRTGMLDEKFNVVVAADKYDSLNQVTYWDGTDIVSLDCYQGSVYTGNGSLNDLLDADGNILVGRLSFIYDVRENRMSVVKGLNMGLMDFRGNWIVKRTIFNEHLDD